MFSSGSTAAGGPHSSAGQKQSARPGSKPQQQEQDSEEAEADEDDDEEEGDMDESEQQPGSSEQDPQTATEGDASASSRALADPSCPVLSHSKDVNEEANVIRKAFKIKVTGGEPPCPLRSFAEMGVRFKAAKKLLANISAGGYGEPTPIQRQAIPALLGGRELLAVAPTGAGCSEVADLFEP